MRAKERQLLVPRCPGGFEHHGVVQLLNRRERSVLPRPLGNPRRVLEDSSDRVHEAGAIAGVQFSQRHGPLDR